VQRFNTNNTTFECFSDGASVGFQNTISSSDTGADSVFPVTLGTLYSCTSNGTIKAWAELR
jgi:hypothetical protein